MPSTSATTSQPSVPLCVDLDGTLIRTDVLWESLMLLVKRNPFYLLLLPGWFLQGRAKMKKEIAARVTLNPANLPYHLPFLEYLKQEKTRGRKLVLATAADRRLADEVAGYIGLFDEVVASDGATNMRGRNKGNTLTRLYGVKGFDYAGNSTVDLPVWEQSRCALVVNANERLAERARGIATVSHVFNESDSTVASVVKALRPHQWVKSVIIFVPLITSHKFGESALVIYALIALVAFSLCASGVYVLNDLLDLEADRQHATKRRRPFASGRLPLPMGFLLIAVTLSASAVTAFSLSHRFVVVLMLYFLLTTSYSLRLKQMALLDVFFLAGLYTMRLIAGHAATGIEYSFWLLAFSMFIFLSLALVKRYTELYGLKGQNQRETTGRGYRTDDLELVAMLGIASGFMSVLVMALYVNSEQVQKLYLHPTLLLTLCPMLLYWISRVWLRAYRGRMHDDPIVFALKDPLSYAMGLVTLLVLWLATGRFGIAE